LVAGHVDLNTRQAPVLQAILSNALLDKDDATVPLLTSSIASALAAQLVTRTTNTSDTLHGPLVNRANLVGQSNFSDPTGATPGSAASTELKSALTGAPSTLPNAYYSGFSADIGTVGATKGTTVALIPRQREAAMRALSDVGNTRVWNLLIDLVAQSGRYPTTATQLANFVVMGEKHYWLHVAIDRATGQIVDQQMESVTE
jgi:hypothetical protein